MATTTETIVGTVEIVCPECEVTVPATVTCRVVGTSDRAEHLVCEPDMTDIHAHIWQHEES
jgi:hypothetical protein